MTRASVAAGPRSLWRYPPAPVGRARRRRRRLDAARPLRPALRCARHRAAAEARGREPDARRTRTASRPSPSSAALDHGVTTLCCSSTGNLGDAVAAAAAATGLEAIVLAPVGGESAAVAARHRARASSPSAARTTTAAASSSSSARSSRGASSAATSTRTRARARRRSRSRSPSSSTGELPDAVICPAASGTLFAKLAQGFSELTRAGPRRRAGAAHVRRPGTRLEPDR